MVAKNFGGGADLSIETICLHGTALAIESAGILLRGPSGAGKSDLALRMIDSGRAILVSDDQTVLHLSAAQLVMTAPASIRGRVEVRGVGIVSVETVPQAPLKMIVDLVHPDRIERLPEARTETVLGHPVPVLALSPFEASAPAKIRTALRHLTEIVDAEAAE